MVTKYIIYMHRLKLDNRVYIGITCQSPKKRWQNGLGYVHSSYFYNAINKYGWNNFEHIILFENLTKKDAEEKEIELIKLYKSNIKGFGFNINGGGHCPTMTEEQKQKIRNSEKGKIVSKEVGRKISQTKKEKFAKNGLTDKEKERYKKRIKPIICIETGIVYYGQRDLKNNGFNPSGVYLVCVGRKQIANKYHWRYYEKR